MHKQCSFCHCCKLELSLFLWVHPPTKRTISPIGSSKSALFSNHFLKILFKMQRNTHTFSFASSQNAHNGQDRAKLKPGFRYSIPLSTWVARTRTQALNHHVLPLRIYIGMNQKSRAEPGLKVRHSEKWYEYPKGCIKPYAKCSPSIFLSIRICIYLELLNYF